MYIISRVFTFPEVQKGERDCGRQLYDQEREIIRAGDAAGEDELPPPSTTRNMLAKFQEIQEEAQREAANLKTPPPSKKVKLNF